MLTPSSPRSLPSLSQVEKYDAGHFGYCPRVFCHSHPVLPCGRSDLPGLDTVKLYCANCIDCYAPPSSRFHGVDGAFFGTTFPHLLFQCYRDLAPSIIAPQGSNANSLNLWSTTAKGGEHEQQQQAAAAAGASSSASSSSSSDSDSDDSDSPARRGGGASGSGPSPSSALKPHLVGSKEPQARLYTPRIYGFRVSEQAKSGPRMRWLRMRPESWRQLETGQPPRGGGAPERQGTGAVNVGVSGQAAAAIAAASAGVDGAAGGEVDADGQRNGATGATTNLGRPIAGRGG